MKKLVSCFVCVFILFSTLNSCDTKDVNSSTDIEPASVDSLKPGHKTAVDGDGTLYDDHKYYNKLCARLNYEAYYRCDWNNE